MHYYHQLNHAQRRKFIRRVFVLFLVVVLVAAAIFGYIYMDNRRPSSANTAENTTSKTTTSTFESKVQIFRSAYFQFQANSNWSQALPESTEDKFVYRHKRGAIIGHELIVYVNRDPDDRPVNRILPVTLKGESELSPGNVSEHCVKKAAGIDQRTVPLVVEKVSFICTPNEPNFNVLVGLVGGGTKLNLKRADGTTARYVIFYSNVTAAPEGMQLQSIVNTFQAR